MGKFIFNGVLVLIVLAAACVAWPYFTKSRVNYDLKAAASYGTKHGIDETYEFLEKALDERGVDYDPDDIWIEKDERDTVSVYLVYEDSISLFGVVFKKLEFELEAKQKNVKEYF